MRLGLLKSRLARKILTFFILASLLPLLLSTYVSYRYVSGIIETESLHNLQSASKEYGLSIFFRLKLARDTLSLNAEELAKNNTKLVTLNNLDNYFSAIAFIKEDRIFERIYGDIPDNINKLLENKTQSIFIVDRTPYKKDIYMRLKNGIIGKIDLNYLWNTSALSTENTFCVSDFNFSPIYCQDTSINKSFNQLKKIPNKKDNRKLKNQLDDKSIMITYWSLFLDHEFGINDWHIIASEELSITQKQLREYNTLFFPFLLFSLLLVTLLSSILIRKNLDAISKINSATQEFIKGNFTHRVSISQDDELSDLGESFNLISDNMSAITREYKAFSDIDKLILASVSNSDIIDKILVQSGIILNTDKLILINKPSNKLGFNPIYSMGFEFHNDVNSSTHKNIYDLLKNKSVSQPAILKLDSNEKILFKQLFNPYFDPNHQIICILPIINKIDHDNYILGVSENNHFNALSLKKADVFIGRISIAFEAIRREADLYKKANFDILTQLPNKNKIATAFKDSINLLQNQPYALLFLDLDRFKQINDNFGHSIGDKLLIKIAAIIKDAIQDESMAARIGGDEFLFLLNDKEIGDLRKKIKHFCNKLIKEIKKPFKIENHILHIGCSIGAFICKDVTDSFEDAIRYADIAMYFSKKKGGNQFSIYQEEMSDELLKRSLLERDLRQAIKDDAIKIHFQPKFYASSQTLSGFESLLRWKHPHYGAIAPFITIEIAEDIGVIDALGQLIISKSISQLQEWLEKGYAVKNLAINISPMQLAHKNFSSFIESTINQFSLVKAEMIEIEITESLMLQGKEKSIEILEKVKSIGAKIAIDDFGTGYSSLSYLLDLPADTLKIDRAFVMRIEQDPNATALLSALIGLGKSMGYKIIAEGVETQKQLDFLIECGTDELQGYYFSKPLPSDIVEERYFSAHTLN